MPYSTEADLISAKDEEILAQLTGDTGSIVSSIVDDAIESADGDIDGAIGGRYTVPLTGTIPGMIKNYSVILAISFLYRRQHNTPEDVATNEERVRKELEEIKAGDRMVPGLSADDVSVIQPFEDESVGGYTKNKFDMNSLEW